LPVTLAATLARDGRLKAAVRLFVTVRTIRAAAGVGAPRPVIQLVGRERKLDRRIGVAGQELLRALAPLMPKRWIPRARQKVRLVEVPNQKILVERAIVVEIVTASALTGIECEPAVRGAFITHRLVAPVAKV